MAQLVGHDARDLVLAACEGHELAGDVDASGHRDAGEPGGVRESESHLTRVSRQMGLKPSADGRQVGEKCRIVDEADIELVLIVEDLPEARLLRGREEVAREIQRNGRGTGSGRLLLAP